MTTNIELAKKVARHVTLHSVTLCRANIESHFDPLAVPSEVNMMQGHRCEYKNELIDDRKRLSVIAEFKFGAKEVNDGQEIRDLMELDASFLLIYSIPSDLKIEDRCFQYFADVNGPYNAWPYWRELVQTATGRVGLAGVTVPVFRPQAMKVEDACADRSAPTAQ